jgi:glycerol uptake operon antiterminator
LEHNRVLPAVRDDEGLRRALHADQDILFVLYGDILSLETNVGSILKTGRTPFIHLDMIQGLAPNLVVLDYFLHHFRRECGIITTKPSLARKAKELGLPVIQRYFMLDSLSVESAAEGIAKSAQDAIEIMPGILPRIIAHLSHQTQVPIIAGGLIQQASDVEKILASGAIAVSTSRPALWALGHA